MQSQPEPDPKGDIREILKFINIKDKDLQILYLCSLVTDFIPGISHPIKVFYGMQGSAKTTTSKITRTIVDPSYAETCRNYKDIKEFAQYLAHNHCIVIDNLSKVNKSLSDLICAAVTGDGYTKRKLFGDDDDIIYTFQRCFILNGINNVAVYSDLLRRCLLFELPSISKYDRKEERALKEDFNKSRGYILGGIFNVLSSAMEVYPEVKPDYLYSLADFTRWGAAISEVLGFGTNTFINAYENNISKQNEELIANNVVGLVVKELMQICSEWSGTSTQLLKELRKIAANEGIDTKGSDWPKASNYLSRTLNEIKPTLESLGIKIDRERNERERVIIIKKS